MDGKRMNLWLSQTGPLALALFAAAGVAVGVIFFRALRWGARVLVEGGAVSTALALTLGRFGLVGVLLYFAVRAGAVPLLAASAGIFMGRFLVMRATELDAR
jgi:hypothetical protein